MNKKVKYWFLLLGAMMILSFFSTKESNDPNQMVNFSLKSAEAGGILDDLAEWYLSEIYDCEETEEEVTDYAWGIGTWGDVQDEFDAEWALEVGGDIDDDDWGLYYGETGSNIEVTVECVGGDTVAHCSDC